MSALLSRSAAALPSSPAGRTWPAAVVAAALTAAGGAGLLVAPVLVVWISNGADDPLAGALRLGAAGWLAVHGVPLHPASGLWQFVPWGLAALLVALLHRAGRRLGRWHRLVEPRGVAVSAVAFAVAYGLVCGLVAMAVRGDTIGVAPPAAVACGGALALLAGGAGLVREAGLAPGLLARVPGRVRRTVRVAAVALLSLLAGGALTVTASLVAHAGDITALARVLDAGALGGALVCLLGIAVLPNLVVWAAAYATGAGFAVGVGTAVAPLGISLGSVPALPVLAALPSGGPWPVLLLPLAVPVVAGMLTARCLVVAGAPDTGARALLVDGLVAAALAGAAAAVLALASGGAVGDQRLSAVGPVWWLTGAAVAGELALVVSASLGLRAWRVRRRQRSAREAVA